MGYFDLQVNGYAGLDFNSDLSSPDAAQQLNAVCHRLEQQDVDGILATIITDTIPTMVKRITRLVELRSQSEIATRIIRGLHLEGPFINPAQGYRGAHPVDAIIPADISNIQRLLEAGNGLVKLVTLAPEADPKREVIRELVRRGVVVSAGHTNASLDQLKAAIDTGLSMFTHLGNGCPMTMDRHDNIVQRALSLHRDLWLCFIADGAHVPYFALKNYLESTGFERVIVVTDCMVAADLGPGRYQFGRWDLNIGDDLVARSPDGTHLVGSTVTMPQTLHNLTEKVGLSKAIAAKLTSHNPEMALTPTPS